MREKRIKPVVDKFKEYIVIIIICVHKDVIDAVGKTETRISKYPLLLSCV